MLSGRERRRPVLQAPGLPAKQELVMHPEADPPRTGGFTSHMPEDAWYAVEVCREQDPVVSCRVQLRLEPEHPGPAQGQRPADSKR